MEKILQQADGSLRVYFDEQLRTGDMGTPQMSWEGTNYVTYEL